MPRQIQYPSDTARIEVVERLLDAGLGDYITLGHDIGYKHELTAYGGHGYAHVLKTVVPRMRQRGIPEADIEKMLVHTPARLVTIAGAPS